MHRSRPRRGTRAAAGAGVVVLLLAGAGVGLHRERNVRVALRSDTVLISGGERRAVPVGSRHVLPGSRVAGDGADLVADLDAERRWLAEGAVPDGAYADATCLALLDLRVLLLDDGASVASWSGPWRYVWPRDAASTVAALSATGHLEDAARVLGFLQAVQEDDGRFAARYLPTGSGEVPDGRGIQLDGSGWALWAVRQWAEAHPEQDRAAAVARFAPLVARSTRALLDATEGPDRLPPASMDYWELPEHELTLATAALTLAGLQSGAVLADLLGEPDRSRAVAERGHEVAVAVRTAFAPNGFQRYARGGGRDAGLALLMPPFVTGFEDDALSDWVAAQRDALRPAGGLAPGAGWPSDGTSWTPETALFALGAATLGDGERATAWLDWLVAHRTPSGSFPEKVLSDGSPAGPSPLGWTAATFVLAVLALGAGAVTPAVDVVPERSDDGTSYGDRSDDGTSYGGRSDDGTSDGGTACGGAAPVAFAVGDPSWLGPAAHGVGDAEAG